MAFDQKKYVAEYNKEHYARVSINLTPEYKVRLQLATAKCGCSSISEFVRKCIDEALKDTPQE